jgi:hypothetical protein
VGWVVLRVTTLYASSASATAAYYTRYLAGALPVRFPACGRAPKPPASGCRVRCRRRRWSCCSGAVTQHRGHRSETPLGRPLEARNRADGRVVRAVAGFDATFSAPKSVSVWWALTGDQRLLDAHDTAVSAALAHLERFGATTRMWVNGARQFVDTGGLTVAAFRQTTSRADDPQLHTHAVISAKVATPDGRWWALDARYLKREQRMFGGVYQSVLRRDVGRAHRRADRARRTVRLTTPPQPTDTARPTAGRVGYTTCRDATVLDDGGQAGRQARATQRRAGAASLDVASRARA